MQLLMDKDFCFESCRPKPNSPLVGWICSYTPEELILAAGFTPYRIEAAASGGGSEAYLPANLCPYTRSILDVGLTERVDGLIGMVFANSCDAMRRLADAWERYSRIPVLYRLDCPRRQDAVAEDYLVTRYRELIEILKQRAGHPICQDDIRNAIEILNESRQLISRIAELRRMPGNSLTSADFSDIVRCSLQADKSLFNREAVRFLAAHKSTNPNRSSSPKVLLCGCAVIGRELHEMIESCGVRIVGDDLCTGERQFDGLVDTSLDPLRGVARRYLQRRACARMKGSLERTGNHMDLAARLGADGIIFLSLKFCDLVQSDLPRVLQAARNQGIPLLHIERDSLDGTSGQIRTRIEALAEMLEKKR